VTTHKDVGDVDEFLAELRRLGYVIVHRSMSPCPDCATRTDAPFHDPEAEPCHRCGDTGYILAAAEQETPYGHPTN
jgi:hypothetical protein